MGSWTLNAGPTYRSIAPIESADLCLAVVALPHLPVTQELHPAAVRPQRPCRDGSGEATTLCLGEGCLCLAGMTFEPEKWVATLGVSRFSCSSVQ